MPAPLDAAALAQVKAALEKLLIRPPFAWPIADVREIIAAAPALIQMAQQLADVRVMATNLGRARDQHRLWYRHRPDAEAPCQCNLCVVTLNILNALDLPAGAATKG